jgi:multiple sugar transport system substrate-binding protein
MTNVKKLLVGALAVILVLIVAACGNGNTSSSGNTKSSDSQKGTASDKKVTIEFWHTYSDSEEKILLEKVKPAFENSHANIELKLTRMPYEGLKQQVIAGVAGEATPDLMRMDIIWVPEFASQGALMNLSEMPGFDVVNNSVFESTMSTNYFDGSYYGLPLNTNTKIAIYNKDSLAEAGLSEAPKTMDELVAAAEALKAKGKYGIGISGAGAWSILPYFWSLGGSITNDDYTKVDGYLNSEASVKAFETIIDWHKRGLVVPAILGGEPGTWDGIKTGEYAMIDDGPWFFSILNSETEIANTGFDPMEKIVRGLIPEGPGGSKSVVGGENLVIFEGAKNPEAAWIFAQWMLTEEPQLMMTEAGMIPTNKAAAEAINEQDIPFIAEYVKQLETALPRTPIPQWGEAESIFNLASEKAIRGELGAKQALDEATKQIEEILP